MRPDGHPSLGEQPDLLEERQLLREHELEPQRAQGAKDLILVDGPPSAPLSTHVQQSFRRLVKRAQRPANPVQQE